jgi:hypothetical protein
VTDLGQGMPGPDLESVSSHYIEIRTGNDGALYIRVIP